MPEKEIQALRKKIIILESVSLMSVGILFLAALLAFGDLVRIFNA